MATVVFSRKRIIARPIFARCRRISPLADMENDNTGARQASKRKKKSTVCRITIRLGPFSRIERKTREGRKGNVFRVHLRSAASAVAPRELLHKFKNYLLAFLDGTRAYVYVFLDWSFRTSIRLEKLDEAQICVSGSYAFSRERQNLFDTRLCRKFHLLNIK